MPSKLLVEVLTDRRGRAGCHSCACTHSSLLPNLKQVGDFGWSSGLSQVLGNPPCMQRKGGKVGVICCSKDNCYMLLQHGFLYLLVWPSSMSRQKFTTKKASCMQPASLSTLILPLLPPQSGISSFACVHFAFLPAKTVQTHLLLTFVYFFICAGQLKMAHLCALCKPACQHNSNSPFFHAHFADVLAKAERIMGGSFESPPAVHLVRDVSPGKVMLCITFRVPEAVAFNGRLRERESVEAGERKGGDAAGQAVGGNIDAIASEAKRQRT